REKPRLVQPILRAESILVALVPAKEVKPSRTVRAGQLYRLVHQPVSEAKRLPLGLPPALQVTERVPPAVAVQRPDGLSIATRQHHRRSTSGTAPGNQAALEACMALTHEAGVAA